MKYNDIGGSLTRHLNRKKLSEKEFVRLIKESIIEYEPPQTLSEGKFIPKHFPLEGDGFSNEGFSNAGASQSSPFMTDPQEVFSMSFKVRIDAKLIMPDDIENSPVINAGDNVSFLSPPQLFKANQLGLRGTSIYAQVKTSSGQEGYIMISKIEKPAGKSQARVGHGALAQKKVAAIVNQIATENGASYEFVSEAPERSNAPDLIIKYGGQPIQFEIKGRGSSTGYIYIFDKSIRRGYNIKILDQIASKFAAALWVKLKYDLKSTRDNLIPGPEEEVNLASALRQARFPYIFEGIIDFYKKYIDERYGFAGDVDVIKSGKIPSDFTTTDKELTGFVRDVIIQHLQESGDDYFVVYTRSEDTTDIYSSGTEKNPIGAKPMPEFSAVKIATAGGKSSGSTRVGLKIAIAASKKSNIPDQPELGQI